MSARLLLILSLGLILTGYAGLPAQAEGAGKFIVHLPQKLVGSVAGFVVGTPIAMVRCTKRELIKETKEAHTLGGVRPKVLSYATSAFFGIPSGAMSGVWYGVIDGTADGWVNSGDKPFSKATFSLDKLTF
ncbi:MAG: hypothetical protein KGS72_24260 [Cyanobacteria bacterium REEB67]|nr:hypothetical protein [Cyanobacteria bacterium REEB67]